MGLAIPPGFATAIFPPAGLALLALLLGGRALWPGIWLGSFLLNLWHGSPTLPLPTALLVAAGIGIGASVQGLVGATLVRHLVGFPTALDEPQEILLFYLVGGPLSCLINASLAPLILYFSGTIGSGILLFTWWTWWVGDSIGVIFTVPVLLTFIGHPATIWRQRRLSVALPMSVSLLLLILLFFQTSSWEEERLHDEFLEQAQLMQVQLQQHLTAHLDTLVFIAAFFESSNEVSQEEFQIFTQPIFERYAGIQALEWLLVVPAEERAGFEASRQAVGYPDFRVTERAPDGTLIPAAPRPYYVPVTFVEPLQGNEAALGYDVASDAVRRAALLRSLAQSAPSATSPVTLVQDSKEQFGLLIFMPLYKDREKKGRLQAADGYALAVFQIDTLIEAGLQHASVDLINLEVYDQTRDVEESALPLYSSVAGSPTPPPRTSWQSDFTWAGREWVMRYTPTSLYYLQRPQWQSWALFAVGLLFTTLLGAFLLVITGRTMRVERQVEERTGHLLAILNNVLEAIVALDEEGRFLSANPATEQLFGYALAELEQLTLTAVLPSFPPLTPLMAAQGQGLAALVGKRQEVQGQQKDGSTIPLELAVGRVEREDESFYVALFHDLTERHRVERLKSEFVSTVSHELRTPLTSIRGTLGLILGGAVTPIAPEVHELLDIANRNTEQLIRLINDLLDIEKIESGNLSFQQRPQSLVPLLEQALSSNDAYAQQFGVELQLITPAEPVWVMVDEHRLLQVLNNLLSNAIKFSPRGSEVRVSLEGSLSQARVSVLDQGPGIPAHFRDQLFQKFVQLDASDSRQKGGTGLGLSIARALIERMGGHLDYQERSVGGACFYFELPLWEGERHLPPEPTSKERQ